MNHIDKLILLAVLGAVGGLLVYLARRAAREREAMPVVIVPPTPVKVEEPARTEPRAAIVVAEPAPRIPDAVAAVEGVVVAEVVVPTSRRKKKQVAVVTSSAARSSIDKVLGMLKEQDTLAAAFVLREILAPPVSKR